MKERNKQMSPFERIQNLERRMTALESPVNALTRPEDNPNAGRSTGPFIPPDPVRTLKAPGYLAFVPPNPPASPIRIANGSSLPSVEDWMQIELQALVGGPGVNDENGVSSLKWDDAHVREHLSNIAGDRGGWLEGKDPNYMEPARSALIEKYIEAFRIAVTPV